ncbi:hypothetical protein A0H81_02113 [Grifola frondosa]|uniref:PKS/mFAS DH domain-containing protein n=1 Tax=Grifola frondosa TaxID=5627 RepID=A0A1C7MNJ0_GRIFR|nr:hypothetical protein A0H81_02113 [Grifola frondosa]
MGPVVEDLRVLGAQARLAARTLPMLVQPGDASVFTSEYSARQCGMRGNTSAPPLRCRDASDFAVLCAAPAGLYTLPVAHDIAWRKVFNALAENTPRAAAALAPTLPKPRFSLLDSSVGLPSAEGVDGMFKMPFSLLADLVDGHKVSGFALCPASVCHELAAAGAQLMLEHLARTPVDVVLDLAGITYSNSLVYSPDVARTVRTDITLNAPGEKYVGAFSISSYTTGSERQPHCTGVFDVRGSSERASKLTLASTMVKWRQQAMLDSHAAEMFYTCTAYELVFSRCHAPNVFGTWTWQNNINFAHPVINK